MVSESSKQLYASDGDRGKWMSKFDVILLRAVYVSSIISELLKGNIEKLSSEM